MLFSHVALVGCIVFNAFTSLSLTHAKPIPSGGQSNVSSNLNRNPINAQVNTESSVAWGLKSSSPQQLWPRNDAEVTKLGELIATASKLPEQEREEFFVRDLHSQWENFQNRVKAPGAHRTNEFLLISEAVTKFEYIHGLNDKIKSLFPSGVNIDPKARPYINWYATFIASHPMLPAACMTPSMARSIIAHIATSPELAGVPVMALQVYLYKLDPHNIG